MKSEILSIELLDGATAPTYKHENDAGMDLSAFEDVTLAPGETKLVHTGIKCSVPEGYELQIRPRSGLSLNTPLRVINSPGTVDCGYLDEICVIMQNTSERFFTDGVGIVKVMRDKEENHHLISTKGNKKGWYDIKKGDRIAQMVLVPIAHADWNIVDDIHHSSDSEDRGGGFGSTGSQ